MTLKPISSSDLAGALREAGRVGTAVGEVDLSGLNRIRRYAPEDLTVTVEAGMTLGALQAELRRHGQWLPIDPPDAEGLSIAEIIDRNLSGPRRHGYGTIREHLLGVRVALADGRIIRSGGEVVKNVAGYDLLKLFVGAGRSLGIIVEAAFKLLPRPAREVVVTGHRSSWEEVTRTIDCLLDSPVTPTVFDVHNLAARPGVASLVVGFGGSEEEIDWQLPQARELGLTEPGSLEYATILARSEGHPLRHRSVLPSQLVETLRTVGAAKFVARVGTGAIEYRGPDLDPAPAPRESPVTAGIVRRLKETFDPAGILPAPPILVRA